MVKNCEYCEAEFTTNKESQKFCCENCKIYKNRWDKREPRTPFKVKISRDATDLYEVAEDVQELYTHGNFVSENAMKAIELGHFPVISSSDKRYLNNIWNRFYTKA